MTLADFAGVQREACLAYLPEVGIGDYVLVHVGFAISRLDEQQAMETLAALQEIGELAELAGPDPRASYPPREEEDPPAGPGGGEPGGEGH